MDMGDYFRIAMDERDLNYEKYFEKGDKKVETIDEYNSRDTERLDIEGVINLLIKMGDVE